MAWHRENAVEKESIAFQAADLVQDGDSILLDASNIVTLIGGVLNQDGSSVTGLISEEMVQELHIQKAFVSSNGIDLSEA